MNLASDEELVELEHDGYRMSTLVRVPEDVRDVDLHVFIHGLTRALCDEPPVFSRRVSARRLGAVTVHISDPIFYVTQGCPVGWFLLADRPLYRKLESLVRGLLQRHGLRRVIWHGNSAGGHVAMRFASRFGTNSLAYAIGPQNDVTTMPQWNELEPFLTLPGMAQPSRSDEDIISAQSLKPGEASYFILMGEHDYFHIVHQAAPLLRAVEGSGARLTLRLLRNGKGHGGTSEADYWGQLQVARDFATVESGLAHLARGEQ